MSFQIGNFDIGVGFKGDTSDLGRKLTQAGADVDRFGGKSRGQLRGVADEAGRADDAMGRLANGIKGAFVGGSVAVGLIMLKNNVMAATGAIVEAQVQVDRWRNGFAFGAGGMEAGANEFVFLREEVSRLGLDLASTAGQYMKLVAASRGSSMAGAQTREVFKSIAEASVVMGMNADQNERAMMAVTQMMSKGKVMAEELRGQLGEHLPGAFSIAARAMGVTEVELNKLMETGQVFSADFLPKFAAQLRKELAGSVAESSVSMQANLNRLSTSWLNFKQEIAQGGVGGALSSGVQVLSGDLKVLGDVLEASRKSGDGFWLSVANLSGAAVGRASFGALEMAANGFNGSLNFLSGGLLTLNTNVGLMPDNLRSMAEQLELTNQKVVQAEAEYASLSARLAQAPDNIYIKSELGNLARYIGALRMAQDEQRKMMGSTSTPGPIGSVGSGDTALLRADRAQYERELAARAALRKKYATPKERMEEELAAQRAMLGGLWSPEEEKRVRDSFGKAGGGGGGGKPRGSAPAKDEFADVLGRLTAKDAGLDPSFYKDLETLYQGYQKNRIGADAYRAAVEQLIAGQGFAKDAARELAEADKAAAKALEDQVSAAEKSAETARGTAEAMAREVELIGLSEYALSDLELARYRDAAASLRRRAAIMDDIDLSGRAGEAMRAEAEALDALAESKRLGYSKRADEDVKAASDDFSKTLHGDVKDALSQALRDTKDPLRAFGDALFNVVFTRMSSATANALADALLGVGGGGGGFLGTALSFLASANGNVIPAGPGIGAYSSTVVDKPTLFPFAKGIGLMGEAGAEAIMPLRRTASGRLGVEASGGGAGQVVNHFNINIDNKIGDVASQADVVGGMKVVRAQIMGELSRSMRYGGAAA